MHHRLPKPSRALIPSLLLVLLQACGGGGQSEQQLLASAKTYLAANDLPAAIIQLKNALQKSPESGEARYLLGKALLDKGEPAAAGLELRKAAQAEYEPSLVTPLLAQAFLLTGDDKQVTDRFTATTLSDKSAQAELQTTVGVAYARQGDMAKAGEALQRALAAAPDSARARVFEAQMSAQRRDFPAALTQLAAVTTRDPANAEAWLLEGQIRLQQDADPAAALAAFRKAVAARPKLMPAREAIVLVLLRQGDLAGAKVQVAELKALLPGHPRAAYLEARVAYLAQDFKTTQEITQRLLQAAPNDPEILELAGAAEYGLKSYSRAEALLAQAVQAAPRLQMARLLLARTYLRSSDAPKTLATLKPLLDQPAPSADALAAAAEAHLLNGDAAASEAAFKRAVAARPGDPRIRTELALTQLGKPGGEKALADLENIASTDSGVLADLALISEHLRNKRFDKALKATDALEKKQPDKPLATHLRGRVQLLMSDPKAARASFERALVIEPTYFPATLNLAALDLAQSGPAAARKRFDDLLRLDLKNSMAMLAVANLLARTGGDPKEIGNILTKAVADNPTLAAPRIRLVDHHLSTGDAKAALAAAQGAAAALPGHADVLFALGRAQLAAGAPEQAASAFSQLATLETTSPRGLLGLADAHIASKESASAVKDLRRALEVSPGLLIAQRKLIELALASQRPADALEVARQVKTQRPKEGIGYLLEGQIEAAGQHWDAAIVQFRAGLQQQKSSELAIALHKALLAADKRADAGKFAASWSADPSADSGFTFYLGDTAVDQRNYAEAESRYRQVLKAQPGNALAMNNVASMLLKQNKPGALQLAEKANQAMPDQAPLMDTLATALAAENQIAKALEVQRRAVAKAPADPSLRLNLARLLILSGDKTKARTELETLQKLGPGFADQAAVTSLLAQV